MNKVKVKVRMSIECEMELDPYYYEDVSTIEDMIKVEQDNAQEDPFLYLDFMESKGGKINLEVEEVES